MGIAASAKLEDQAVNSSNVGADIRALRKSRGITLVDFAKALGRSVGFASQIERGLSEPSINDLRNIARIVDVPISFFFGTNADDEAEARHVVRAGKRRKLGNSEGKLTEELLSPDLGGSFEILRCEFEPGAELTKPQQRDTEEAGHVISGTFEIEIDGTWYTLRKGDSFRFAGVPYRWRNKTKQLVILIWVVSPPVY